MFKNKSLINKACALIIALVLTLGILPAFNFSFNKAEKASAAVLERDGVEDFYSGSLLSENWDDNESGKYSVEAAGKALKVQSGGDYGTLGAATPYNLSSLSAIPTVVWEIDIIDVINDNFPLTFCHWQTVNNGRANGFIIWMHFPNSGNGITRFETLGPALTYNIEGGSGLETSKMPLKDFRLQVLTKNDGTGSVSYKDIDPEDGSYSANWTKVFEYSGVTMPAATGNYYFPTILWSTGSAGTAYYDNYKVYTVNSSSVETVLFEKTSFEDMTWVWNGSPPTAGKAVTDMVGGTSGTVTIVPNPSRSCLLVNDPADDEVLAMYNRIPVDQNCDVALDITTEFKITSLTNGRKLGFMFNMPAKSSQATDAGVAYLYFTQNAGLTEVNLSVGGVDIGPAFETEEDLTGELVKLHLTVDKDGVYTVDLGEFGDTVFDSESAFIHNRYIGIAASGGEEGECFVEFKNKFIVKTYEYKAGNGRNFSSDFNAGIDKYWSESTVTSDGKAINFATGEPLNKGLVFEDGMLKMSGITDGTQLNCAAGTYADFEVEFDLILPAERPEIKEPWKTNHPPDGTFGMMFVYNKMMIGSRYAEGQGKVINLGKDNIVSFYDAGSKISNSAKAYTWVYGETYRIKIGIQHRGALTIDIKNSTDSDFVNVVNNWKAGESYGYFSFTGTDCAYYFIDNVVVRSDDYALDKNESYPTTASKAALTTFTVNASEMFIYSANPTDLVYSATKGGVAAGSFSGSIWTYKATAPGTETIRFTVTDGELTQFIDVTFTFTDEGPGDPDPTDPTNPSKKGCGSVSVGGNFRNFTGLAALCVLALPLLTKKREENLTK